MDLAALREAVAEGRLAWQQHALQRLAERNLCREHVVRAILEGELIEDYPDAYPLPSALILHTTPQQSVHAVVAWDEPDRRVYVITVYIPDAGRFGDDYRTRKT